VRNYLLGKATGKTLAQHIAGSARLAKGRSKILSYQKKKRGLRPTVSQAEMVKPRVIGRSDGLLRSNLFESITWIDVQLWSDNQSVDPRTTLGLVIQEQEIVWRSSANPKTSRSEPFNGSLQLEVLKSIKIVLPEQMPSTLRYESQHADLRNAAPLTQFGQRTKFGRVLREGNKMDFRLGSQATDGGNCGKGPLKAAPDPSYAIMGCSRRSEQTEDEAMTSLGRKRLQSPLRVVGVPRSIEAHFHSKSRSTTHGIINSGPDERLAPRKSELLHS
jgi:hypothetical protein